MHGVPISIMGKTETMKINMQGRSTMHKRPDHLTSPALRSADLVMIDT